MKVLFANGAHPDEKIGGAELQSWLLSKAMANSHDVTYLAVRSDTKQDVDFFQDGVHVIKLAKKRKFSLKEFQRIYNCIKHESPDVVHLRMFDYIYLFKIISIRCNIPIVYHISSAYNFRAFRPGRLGQVVSQTRHLINYLLMRRLAGLICQTRDQRNSIGTAKGAIVVIRNSALGGWNESSKKDEHLVLWVGNIKPLKRPLDFVEMADNLSDTAFHFLMIGYPQNAALTNKLIKKSNDLDNLDFVPGVPIAEIGAFFRKASIFVSTSSVEGYPNTFIQAIQSATPVVSLGLDPDNVLTNYQVGVCVSDKRKLSACLAELMNDKKRLNGMRSNTKRCLYDNFDIARNAKTLEQYLLGVKGV